MTYRGRVKNGVVVLDRPGDLADGTEVSVRPLKDRKAVSKPLKRPRTVAERMGRLVGCLEGLPSDLADNHDHYLYGVPKQSRTGQS